MAATEIVVENEGVRKDKWKIIYLYQMQTADNVSVLIADSSKKNRLSLRREAWPLIKA